MTYLLTKVLSADDDGPIDSAGLDGVYKPQDGDGGPEGLVLEALDLYLLRPLLLEPIVSPGQDLGLHDGRAVGVESGEEREGVGLHQLPHCGEQGHEGSEDELSFITLV